MERSGLEDRFATPSRTGVARFLAAFHTASLDGGDTHSLFPNDGSHSTTRVRVSMLTLLLILAAGFAGGIIAIGARRSTEGSDKELADLRERMLRLEQSVESMAGEMDRVSEGQRFLTALLEDRAKAQPALRPPSQRDGEGGS